MARPSTASARPARRSVIALLLGSATDVVRRPQAICALALAITIAQLFVRVPIQQLVHALVGLRGIGRPLHEPLTLFALGGLCAALVVLGFTGAALGTITPADRAQRSLLAWLRHGAAYVTAGLVGAVGLLLAGLLQLTTVVEVARLAWLFHRPILGAAVFALLFGPATLCAALFGGAILLALARLAHRSISIAGPLSGLRTLGSATVSLLEDPGRALALATTLTVANVVPVLLATAASLHALGRPTTIASTLLQLLAGILLAFAILVAGLTTHRAFPERRP